MSCLEDRNSERIERYLREEHAQQDLDAFEAHVLECDDCARELEALAALRGELTRRRDEIEETTDNRSASTWRLWMALAAALIVVVGLVFLLRPAGNQLAAIASVEPPVYRESRLRGAVDEADQQFQDAMQRYSQQEYSEAIAGLESAAALDADRLDIPFFLGASRLLAGDVAKAKEDLDRVIAAGDTPYLEEALKLRVQAYLLLGDGDAASKDLRAMIELDGDWRERAQSQLEQLEARWKAET